MLLSQLVIKLTLYAQHNFVNGQQVLKEFAIKEYVLDKKCMENGSYLGEDCFEHLLEEIREIRLSERRFYQWIKTRMRQPRKHFLARPRAVVRMNFSKYGIG